MATGTTTPIFIGSGARSNPRTVQPGVHYFTVQIRGAQAVFRGKLWEKAKQLVIASSVRLGHGRSGDGGARAIQRSRQIRKNQAEQLGLSPNLISLVPAVMSDFSISIDFLLDKENRLAQVAGLINSDVFLAAMSLAPEAAAVATTIGSVADKIIQTFMPAEERVPILEFVGDFNITTGSVREGYYVILGTRDEECPLPRGNPDFVVRNSRLLLDGREVEDLSYVIFEIRIAEARGHAGAAGAAWALLLSEAEDEAANVLTDPFARDDERRATWQKCMELLREAQILLRADPNYTRHEARHLIVQALTRCRELVVERAVAARGVVRGALGGSNPSLAERARDEAALGLQPDEDLGAMVELYARQIASSQDVIRMLEG